MNVEPIISNLPASKKVTGHCTIVSVKPLLHDIFDIGRVVARIISRPLADVTSSMRWSKGIVAQHVDAGQARTVSEHLKERDIDVLLIPDAMIVSTIAKHSLHNVTIDDVEICGEISDGSDSPRKASLPLDSLLFAAAVCVRSERRVLSTVEDSVRTGLERSLFMRRVRRRRQNLTEEKLEVTQHHLITLFTREPVVRYDIAKSTLDFRLMQSVPPPFEWSASFSNRLLGTAPWLKSNLGMTLLRQAEHEIGWERITFMSNTAPQQYYDWLLQLAALDLELTL